MNWRIVIAALCGLAAVVIVVAVRVDHFRNNPDMTEAQALARYWTSWVSAAVFAFVGLRWLHDSKS